jgi:hypothetical protein
MLSLPCSLGTRISANVFTPARCDTYTGVDMVTYACLLCIESTQYAQSLSNYGIPPGKKSWLFNAQHKAQLK